MTEINVTALSSNQIASDWNKAIAEAEQLHEKCRSNSATEDEIKRLDELTNVSFPKFEKEHKDKQAEERILEAKERMKLPSRAAVDPNLYVTFGRESNEFKQRDNEGLGLWMAGRFGNELNSTEVYKARKAGYDIDNPKMNVDFDWKYLIQNVKDKYRTILNTGSSGYGSDWKFNTYSQQVVEYLLQESPLLNFLEVETVESENPQTFWVNDDTALIADYLTDHSGTETVPAPQDYAVATGSVTINMFPMDTGYQKYTRQQLSRSAVDVVSTVAKAAARSMARKIEKEVLTAAAAGTSAIGGILLSATQSGSDVEVSDIAMSHFEDAVYNISQPYRDDAIFVVSDSAEKKMYQKCKDSTTRTLFEKRIEDPPTVERLLGKPVISSYWMPAYSAGNKPFLLFSKAFYKLCLTKSNPIEILNEKFHPLFASFLYGTAGGKFFGPSGSAVFIKVVADA